MSWRKVLFAPFLISTVGFLNPVRASVSDSSYVHELPEKKIEENPYAKDLLSTEVKTELTAKDWEGRGKSLPDLLQEIAGIQTRKYGGEGSFQTVSIRGVKGSKVQVYLDNIPLNSAGGGAVDLGKIDLNQLDKIYVYKGIVPAQFGGNGVGGVIHLISRGAGEQHHLSVNTLAGSHGTYKPNLFFGFSPYPKMKISSELSYIQSRNDFEFMDRNGTEANLEDDTLRVRKNNEFESIDGFVQMHYDSEQYALRGVYRLANNNGGIPGSETQETKSAKYTDVLHNGRIEGKFKTWEKKGVYLKTEVSQSFETSRSQWNGEDGLGYTSIGDTVDIGAQSYTTQTLLNGKLAKEKWTGDIWLRGQFEWLKPKEFTVALNNEGWNNSRWAGSVALDVSYAITNPFMVTLGGQIEGMQSHTEGGVSYFLDTLPSTNKIETHPSLRFGALWKITNFISILSNYGWYYRVPSLFEMYGGKSGVQANPALKPERGHSVETGLRISWKKYYAEVTGFYNRNINSIILISSARLWKPTNLDMAQAYGVEGNVKGQLTKWWGFSGNSTFQVPENISNLVYSGNQLPDEPVFSQWVRSEWGPWWGAKLSYTVEYKSRIYRDRANLQPIQAQRLDHAKAVYMFAEYGAVHFGINNIGEVPYENAYRSYPYPGRQYFLSLNLNLKWL